MVRRLLPLLLLALVGCTREPAPEASPASGNMGQNGVPTGEIATPHDFAQKADVPLYPGAATPDGKSNIKRSGAEIRYEIVMVTKDTPDQVLAFYKKRLPKGQQVADQWMGLTPNGHYASVNAKAEAGKTQVTIVVRATEKPEG
jgi:hypothetical protein